MSPEGADAFLSVSAGFSRTFPMPAAGLPPTRVRFRREVFSRIEYLAGRLRPAPTPRRQKLVGFVETLNGWPNEENHPEGQVILRVMTPESDILRARVELNAADYARADQAHMHNLPISVEGEMHQIGRFYRIDQVADFELLHQSQPTAGTA